MILHVYDGEYIQRPQWWYFVFGAIMLTLLVFSLRYENTLGAIILLVLLAGYGFVQFKSTTTVQLQLQEQGIQAGKRFLLYSDLEGFVLEMHSKTGKLMNIVFIGKHYKEIFSLQEQYAAELDPFCEQLQEIIPLLSGYEQSFTEKLMRKRKI